MAEVSYSIDIDLSEKLLDKAYRTEFFRAEASALIADQLVNLRKRRELSQKEVAELTGTQQPAISRAERADYENWNLGNLRKIADALNARLRVIIEPTEDVLAEYDSEPEFSDISERPDSAPSVAATVVEESPFGLVVAQQSPVQAFAVEVSKVGLAGYTVFGGTSSVLTSMTTLTDWNGANTGVVTGLGHSMFTPLPQSRALQAQAGNADAVSLRPLVSAQERKIAELQAELVELRAELAAAPRWLSLPMFEIQNEQELAGQAASGRWFGYKQADADNKSLQHVG